MHAAETHCGLDVRFCCWHVGMHGSGASSVVQSEYSWHAVSESFAGHNVQWFCISLQAWAGDFLPSSQATAQEGDPPSSA